MHRKYEEGNLFNMWGHLMDVYIKLVSLKMDANPGNAE